MNSKLKRLLNDELVLVYQMGKVGSSTIEKSIEGSFHYHTLFRNPPCPPAFKVRRRGLRKVWRFLVDFLVLLLIKSRKKVKIITLIRDPRARNVSMLFQDLPFWYVEYFKRTNATARTADGSDIIKRIYKEVFPHEYSVEWFDKEIFRLTGIDVLNEDFDKEKGFSIYQNKNFEVLLLEMNSIDENWKNIERFVGRSLDIKQENNSEMKWYSSVYREMKQELMNMDDVHAPLLSSKMYQKFYKV